jgi:bacteriocin-like protein
MLRRKGSMASNATKAPEKAGTSGQKPQASKKELSEKDLAKVSGGFNPQPDPPGRR